MILDALINIARSILGWVIDLFPNSTGFDSSVHTAFSSLGGYLEIWKPILPMSTVLFMLGIIILVELSIFGFKTFKWIISHIPYVGGKGN